jgi:outer membrane receptor protein involved in Fe transport
VGAVWQPIEDIRFRGTVAEATRAPNIGELFDPGGQTFQFIDDPCDVNQLSNGTEFRAANCAQILSGLGVDPDTFTDPNSASVAGVLRGNPDLDEEQVDTVTVGFILQPRFVPNLTLSVDWYDIELKNAINAEPPQEAVDICVDLPTVDNDFCGLFVREQGTGAIIDFVQQSLNVAAFNTEGFDFTVDYVVDPSEWGASGNWGVFNFRVVGNKLEELEFINLPGAPADPDLGEENAPEWQVNFDLTWERGPVVLNYRFEYFDETQRYTKETRENNPDIADPKYLDYDAKKVHNVYAAYDFSDSFRLYGGIDNFTDEKPDIGRYAYPVDPVGRFFFLGIVWDVL